MNLTKSLGLVPGDICCLAGAGGKTSCLYTLAYEDPWGSTLATTTTKMRDPRIKEHPFSKIDLGERDSFPPAETDSPCFIASRLLDGHPRKVKGFSIKEIGPWTANSSWSLTVIEADGAAERSLKMPGEREPQIPESCSVFIGVIGLDILGKPASSATVHRFHLMQERTGINEGEILSIKHLLEVIGHPGGLFKGSPQSSRKILVLNKADCLTAPYGKNPELLLQAFAEGCSAPDKILVTTLSDFKKPSIITSIHKRSSHVPL